MISIKTKQKDSFHRTRSYLSKLSGISEIEERSLKAYGDAGLKSLKDNTPKKTGLTANSWYYTVSVNKQKKTASIEYRNTNIQEGVLVALVVDIGHATSTGAWIEGKHYILPALEESLRNTINSVQKEMKRIE